MKATVIFVVLSDEQTATINREGWSCPEGVAYLGARDGDFLKALHLGMMHHVADVEADDPEQIWIALQHGVGVPTRCVVLRADPERRSMDVGDLIGWEDGRIERVASVGFEPAGRDWFDMTSYIKTGGDWLAAHRLPIVKGDPINDMPVGPDPSRPFVKG